MCPESQVYDAAHFEKHENRCKHLHTMFHWEGDSSNTVGLLGDSICKWCYGTPHLEIQAISGLTLLDAFHKIEADKFKLAPFHAILLHIGTNDTMEHTPEEVGQMMYNVLDLLSTKAPGTRLAVSMIIPRPKDSAIMDERRRKANTQLKKVCKNRGVTYMQSYKGVTTDGIFDPDLYARDKLHLKLEGIKRMRRYLRGAVATLMEDLPKKK
jgi:lysophospholipase L1-like esterase